MHWLMALSVLILLATGLLPVMGIQFAWVTIHWITGVLLTLAVLFHILRSLIWQRLRRMLFGWEDIKDTIATLLWFFKLKEKNPPKTGKYSPAQKLIHHTFAIILLTAIITGLLMMVKIDTPFWERDPYWLSTDIWGVIYVLHDFASLFLVSIIMLHVYFALRPEKWAYLRAMIFGWISKDEYGKNHDPLRWEKTEL